MLEVDRALRGGWDEFFLDFNRISDLFSVLREKTGEFYWNFRLFPFASDRSFTLDPLPDHRGLIQSAQLPSPNISTEPSNNYYRNPIKFTILRKSPIKWNLKLFSKSFTLWLNLIDIKKTHFQFQISRTTCSARTILIPPLLFPFHKRP